MHSTGVDTASVNFAERTVTVRFDPQRTSVAEMVETLRQTGFEALHYKPDAKAALLDEERRSRLQGLGIGTVFGMQVMMLCLALYVGEWYGMATHFVDAFRTLALLLTVPVLVITGRPLFTNAWAALRAGSVNMDVPVCLGIVLAYGGSVRATVLDGPVYYESVVMFILLLQGVRFAELAIRRRNRSWATALAAQVPVQACRRRTDGTIEQVDAETLNIGDHIVVQAGELIPADGYIIEGASRVDRAVLTGESAPLAREVDDPVIMAGARNTAAVITVEVSAAGNHTVAAQLLRLADEAQHHRPRIWHLANRIAAQFVTVVLIVALLVAVAWGYHDPARWLEITVAVLVATCALALAIPAAFTMAMSTLPRAVC